jgi:hypothetical protein
LGLHLTEHLSYRRKIDVTQIDLGCLDLEGLHVGKRVLPDRFPTAFGQARFLFLVLKRADELTDLQPGVLELLLLSPLMHSDPAAEWVRSVHSDSKRRMHSEHALKRGPRPTGHGFSGRMPARS